MKTCPNCGAKSYDEGLNFCSKCSYMKPTDQTENEKSSSPTPVTIPETIDECVIPDKLTQNLISWSEKLEKWGKILLLIIVIYGIIMSIVNALVTTEFNVEFKFGVFITELLKYGLIAFIEYLIYHALSLLIGALGSIVKHTRTTALLTEFEIRKKHQ